MNDANNEAPSDIPMEEEVVANDDLEYLSYQKVIAEQTERAESYHKVNTQLEILSRIIPLVLLIGVIAFRIPNFFRNVSPFGQEFSVLSLWWVFTFVFLIQFAISLPFSWLSESIERLFEFSTRTNRKWMNDQAKQLGLTYLIFTIVLLALYQAIHNVPDWWWLYGFLGYFIFAGVLQTLSPWLLSLFTKIETFPQNSTRKTVEALANDLNLEFKDIYLWRMSEQTTKANAAVVGFGKSVRIILGDTLVKNFRSDEIEIVMAHEIAHQQHKDVYRGMLFTGFIALLAFLFVDAGFEWAIGVFNYSSKSDPATIGYVLVSLQIALEFLSVLSLWHTRRREKAADIAAISHIQNLEIYESAFARLGKQNLAYPNPSRLEVILRYSHPPIKERIRYAENFLKTAN